MEILKGSLSAASLVLLMSALGSCRPAADPALCLQDHDHGVHASAAVLVPVHYYAAPAPPAPVVMTYAAPAPAPAAQVKYSGPVVSLEETAQLHAEAIAKLKELIAIQEQINAAGPAPAGADDDGQYRDDSDDGAAAVIAIGGGASYYEESSAAVPAAPAAYTGPKVSEAETRALHAEAIQKLEELIRLQEQINLAGPAPARADDDQDDLSSSKQGVAAGAGAGAAVSASSSSTSYSYSGRKVTKEETECLHRDAIQKLNELVELQRQIALAGPAPAGSDDESASYYSAGPAAAASAGAVVVSGAYSGPKVSEEETRRLHADSIAKLNELIAIQEAIAAAGPAPAGASDDDGSYAAAAAPAMAYSAPAAPAPAPAPAPAAYSGPKVTEEETARLHADAIAERQKLIDLGNSIAAAGPAPAGASDDDDAGAAGGAAYYSGGAAIYVAAPQPAAQVSYQAAYSGPTVSYEETARLHADAIAEREKLIQLGNSIAAGGPAPAGAASADDDASDYADSGAVVAAYVPVVAVPQQQVSYEVQQVKVQKPYDGPQVTEEETRRLHAEAIAARDGLIAQQRAIDAAGPAAHSAAEAAASLAASSSYSAGSVSVEAVDPDCDKKEQAGAQVAQALSTIRSEWSSLPAGNIIYVKGPDFTYTVPSSHGKY